MLIILLSVYRYGYILNDDDCDDNLITATSDGPRPGQGRACPAVCASGLYPNMVYYHMFYGLSKKYLAV
jgi:hypothetical protein